MRVVLATVQVPFVQGGAEVLAESLLEALRAAGHQAEIAAIPFKWYPPERILDCILACRLLDLTAANGRSIDRVIGLKFPAYLVPHPNKVLWLLHQHRQAYEQWDHPLSDMVRFGNGREIRDAIRGTDNRLIPEARAVFTIAENVSRRLKTYCGIDSTPLYHPPQHPEAFRCQDPADNYFFFPSRINPAKRQHLAVQGLAEAGGNSRLIFCGESDDAYYLEKLHKSIEEKGLRSRVEFLGRVSEKEKIDLYARSLGVIYPPLDEDYGYITLEAMLSSKPVITCADSGGPLEFVEDETSGLVVEAEGAAIGQAMRRLEAGRSAAAALGRAGREIYLAKDITWAAVIEHLLA
jgi:glycosyltransferase involved in cell wall biosynthesis